MTCHFGPLLDVLLLREAGWQPAAKSKAKTWNNPLAQISLWAAQDLEKIEIESNVEDALSLRSRRSGEKMSGQYSTESEGGSLQVTNEVNKCSDGKKGLGCLFALDSLPLVCVCVCGKPLVRFQ